jgi:hypothetical protein
VSLRIRSTRSAKAAFRLSGKLRRVKTPQRYYVLEPDSLEFTPGGWRWFDCRLSQWLLRASLRWDPEHWDHWALAHEDCIPSPCSTCGGDVCHDV